MNKRRTTLIVSGLLVLVGGASLLAYVVRQRRDPSACPYGLRFSLALPRPFVTRSRLREILSPESGERVLEVGPGTGYYAPSTRAWHLEHHPDTRRRTGATLPGWPLRRRLPNRHSR
jgi:hypothetical protein